MKQDYLWDKTGSDAEIENLENALAVFRYKETAPPAIPVKVVPFRKVESRRSFRLAYAIAACAAFVMIGSGLWFQLSPDEVAIQENWVKTIEQQNSGSFPEAEIVKNPAPIVGTVETSPEIKIESIKRTASPKAVRINKTVPPIVHQTQKKTKNAVAKKPVVQLTKEEQYAYEQLMLALSITSSKLKMVKDKVEGLEE